MTDFDYGSHEAEPDISDFDELNKLVKDLRLEEISLEELEEQVTTKKQQILHLRTVVLPELMERMGLTDFTTKQGFKVKMADEIHASMPKAVRRQAVAWLNAQGDGAIVKHNFKMSYRLSQKDEALAAKEALQAAGIEFVEDMNVHPSTLKAYAKEKLQAGEELPEDLFTVHRNKIVKIK